MTIALYALGGATTAVDTEDVAVRVATISPGMFAWRKYPEHIDKELVRVALSDARLKKKWVVGSHDRGGWVLTPTGQEFARRNIDRIDAAEVRRSGREERQLERERIRLMSTAAFEAVLDGRDPATISADEVDAFFRINVYVQGQARERKIARIENEFGDDRELGEAVRVLASISRNREP